jgi:hypothetical protein
MAIMGGGKLRDVQTGLNNNLHAIYGGVQFGRGARVRWMDQ